MKKQSASPAQRKLRRLLEEKEALAATERTMRKAIDTMKRRRDAKRSQADTLPDGLSQAISAIYTMKRRRDAKRSQADTLPDGLSQAISAIVDLQMGDVLKHYANREREWLASLNQFSLRLRTLERDVISGPLRDELRHEIAALSKQYARVASHLDHMATGGFWGRLRWLVTGR